MKSLTRKSLALKPEMQISQITQSNEVISVLRHFTQANEIDLYNKSIYGESIRINSNQFKPIRANSSQFAQIDLLKCATKRFARLKFKLWMPFNLKFQDTRPISFGRAGQQIAFL